MWDLPLWAGRYIIGIWDQDFYIDLLFYHLRLRCFVVIDLKMKEFKPEYAGKMNFYLSAVDDRMRHTDDQPSSGMIHISAVVSHISHIPKPLRRSDAYIKIIAMNAT